VDAPVAPIPRLQSARVLVDDELSAESNMQTVHNAVSDTPLIPYGLDAVISVGYPVGSARDTQFRIWEPRTLGEHLRRGIDEG